MPSVKSLQTTNADGLVEKCIPPMLLDGCKLVTANNKNRMAVCFKVKSELPYDPEGPLLGLSPVKARIKKTRDGKSCIAAVFTIAKTW